MKITQLVHECPACGTKLICPKHMSGAEITAYCMGPNVNPRHNYSSRTEKQYIAYLNKRMKHSNIEHHEPIKMQLLTEVVEEWAF